MNDGKPLFEGVLKTLAQRPVAAVADEVVASVQSGKVTVLTGETGSGKTLIASSRLADASDHPVVVLVPRRFLAMDAAKNIAEMSGTQVGREVGYAIGRQSGGRSKFTPETKLIFATYGYALSSGMLEDPAVKTVVCDEVHEAGIDTSLARAILHRRLKTDKNLHVLEMSATLNAQRQADYWQDVAQTAMFHAKGSGYPCENRHKPDTPLITIVRDLIKNEGRKGVAVFQSGVADLKSTAFELRKLLDASKMKNVEIAIIHGDLSDEERELALAPPATGNAKVLIGTNVIESGMNIKWLDAGVSDGFTKVPYYRESGAEALVKEDLPQWRIVQQRGRINRFRPGVFVLAAKRAEKDRPEESTAEITRISLNGLVMHAAGYSINPTELHYDHPVSIAGLERSRDELMRLGLLTEDWKLTEKGQFVHSLPLGAEAGMMLWNAPKDILGDAIALAAIAEMKGLRADFRSGHGQDKNSDLLDGLKMFKRLGLNAEQEEVEDPKKNVSWKQYGDVKMLVEDLHRRMGTDPGMNFRTAKDKELVQLILQGSVNKLFEMRTPDAKPQQDGKPQKGGNERGVHSYTHVLTGVGGYPQDKDSVVEGNFDRFAIASLREIPSREGKPKVVAQQITKLSKDDLCLFAAKNPGIITDMAFERDAKKHRDTLVGKYLGQAPIRIGIPKILTHEMKSFIEPDYTEFCERAAAEYPEEKPAARQNQDVWDGQQQRTQEKRHGKKKKGR
ncbi:MAG: DEAD/DEAH box helicase [Proteobacteria bacterium]|nr:DEAD/DEAH box helicase [Pseudomonadota bacterium]